MVEDSAQNLYKVRKYRALGHYDEIIQHDVYMLP